MGDGAVIVHKKLKVHGIYPSVLYRSFDKLEYAQAFINGQIRFKDIYEYRRIEDINRRDETEGESSYIDQYGTTHGGMFTEGNLIYVLCFSRTFSAMKYQKENFGRYVVKIKKPRLLAKKLLLY